MSREYNASLTETDPRKLGLTASEYPTLEQAQAITNVFLDLHRELRRPIEETLREMKRLGDLAIPALIASGHAGLAGQLKGLYEAMHENIPFLEYPDSVDKLHKDIITRYGSLAASLAKDD